MQKNIELLIPSFSQQAADLCQHQSARPLIGRSCEAFTLIRVEGVLRSEVFCFGKRLSSFDTVNSFNVSVIIF